MDVMDDGWMISVDALPLCAYPPDTLFLPFEMGALRLVLTLAFMCYELQRDSGDFCESNYLLPTLYEITQMVPICASSSIEQPVSTSVTKTYRSTVNSPPG